MVEKIKFIGLGEVVKGCLQELYQFKNTLEIEIYTKLGEEITENKHLSIKPIDSFQSTDDYVFYCASTNEEEVLKKNHSQSRLSIAEENLKITNNLIKKGVFKKGKIFVLTNPGEIVAEYIFRKTHNPQVYALGTHFDKSRYTDILNKPVHSLDVLGFHYQVPIPQLNIESHTMDDNSISTFIESFKCKVADEFTGFRPPIKSGVVNLVAAICAIDNRGKVELSSFDKEHNSFLSGQLDFNSYRFTTHIPKTFYECEFIKNSIEQHKSFMNKLTESIA